MKDNQEKKTNNISEVTKDKATELKKVKAIKHSTKKLDVKNNVKADIDLKSGKPKTKTIKGSDKVEKKEVNTTENKQPEVAQKVVVVKKNQQKRKILNIKKNIKSDKPEGSFAKKENKVEAFKGGGNKMTKSGGYKDNKGGGRSHKYYDKQQQESKYNAFVKSIQDMPEQEFKGLSFAELNYIARRLGIIGASLISKVDLQAKILDTLKHPDREEDVTGVLEKLPDGFGFLRSPRYDYISGPDDIYVSPSQIRRFGLKTGDTVTGAIRKPKDGEKYFALLKISKVNFEAPIPAGDRIGFERLSPVHPDKKFNLEFNPSVISTRLIDIFSPIGKGQRGLIVAPPKVGKTVLLKDIARAILANHPEVYLIVLLIDERPEEVTDVRRTIHGTTSEVISSTFDESASRHVQVAEIVLEKAKRLTESGHDVVILLDSITRLARAYNTIAPASGKILTGGIDANALQRPKKFFGAARYTEEAGSLTIIATALVDTGSRMDEVIYEEFKGTGNMEMHMTRKLANRRIYPSLDLLSSGTRREDLLHPEDVLKKVWIMQKFISTLNVIEGMEFLIDKMKKHKTNDDFLASINK